MIFISAIIVIAFFSIVLSYLSLRGLLKNSPEIKNAKDELSKGKILFYSQNKAQDNSSSSSSSSVK